MCSSGNQTKFLASEEADQNSVGLQSCLWYSCGMSFHTVKERISAGGYLISECYIEDKRASVFKPSSV